MIAPAQAPIGVFDSGVGGLTVAAALRQLLPAEDILYVGDTARVPYGGKSPPTIERYALEIGGFLIARGAKCLVVACNTASALALPELRKHFSVPVLGVVEPGARAAAALAASGRIAVLATRATVASGAYERAILQFNPAASVRSIACPLLVPLIEEGLFDDPLTDLALARYIEPLRNFEPEAIVLGCTHYPLASQAIARGVGSSAKLVDSAHNCALATFELLRQKDLLCSGQRSGSLHVCLTDPSESFLRIAEQALGLQIGNPQILPLPLELSPGTSRNA